MRRLIVILLACVGCQGGSGNGALKGRATIFGAADSSGISVTFAGSDRAVTSTAPDGSYELARKARTGSLIIASAAGTLEGTLTVSLADGQTLVPEISFHPVGTIVGRVTRGGAQSGNGGIVVVASGSSAAATTDDVGNFTLAVAPASYDLTAYTSGFLPGSAHALTVTRGGSTTAPQIDLETAPSQLPVDGALRGVAKLLGVDDASGITVTLGATAVTATTASDGSFMLASPSDGNFSLSFDAGAYHEDVPAVLAVTGSSGFYLDGALYPMTGSTLVLPRGVRLVTTANGGTGNPIADAKGEHIAYLGCVSVPTVYGTTSTDCTLYTVPTAGGAAKAIAAHILWAPVRSPDGTQLAFKVGKDEEPVELWTSAIDGSGAQRVDTNTASFQDPFYSPDGTLLFSYQYYSGVLRVVPAHGGSLIALGATAADVVQTALPAPGGAFVLVRDNCAAGQAPTACDLERVPTDGSARTKLASGATWAIPSPAFDRVLFGDATSMKIVSTSGGAVTTLYSGAVSSGIRAAPTFSGDGNSVYFIALPASGPSALSRVPVGSNTVTTIASDVSRYFVSAGGNQAYLDATTTSAARVVSLADGMVHPLSDVGVDAGFLPTPSGRWAVEYVTTWKANSYTDIFSAAPAETASFHALNTVGAVSMYRLSPDESEIAYVIGDGHATLVAQPMAGGAATPLDSAVTSLCGFSPTGARVLYAAGSVLSAAATSGGAAHALLDGGVMGPCEGQTPPFFIDDHTVISTRTGSSAPFHFQDGIYRLEAK